MIWHPEQDDNWIVPRERLERTLPYQSGREMTRHLAQYVDGLVSAAPAELRDELVRHLAHGRRL